MDTQKSKNVIKTLNQDMEEIQETTRTIELLKYQIESCKRQLLENNHALMSLQNKASDLETENKYNARSMEDYERALSILENNPSEVY